jgi:hypothetical protein
MSISRRGFLHAIAALALPTQAVAASHKRLALLTYPGTGKADIPMGEFMAGVAPLRAHLERTTNRELSVTLSRSIAKFNAAAQSRLNAPELVYGPATSATVFMNAGYLPLVRMSRMASGVIVSKLPLHAIRSVAFPDPESWLAQVGEYTVEILTGRSLQYHYANSQDAAVEALRYGLAEAVAVRPATWRKLRDADPGYQVIARLPETPDFTFLAHYDLDPFLREAVKDALLQLPATTVAALDQVYHVKLGQFTHTDESEFDILRRIIVAAKRFG